MDNSICIFAVFALLKAKAKTMGNIYIYTIYIYIYIYIYTYIYIYQKKKAATIFENKVSLKEKTEDLFTHLGSGGALSHKI